MFLCRGRAYTSQAIACMRGCDSVDGMINLWNKKKVRETRKDDRDGSLGSGDNDVYLRLGKK